MMRRIIVAVVLMMPALLFAQGKPGKVTLSGQLKNFNSQVEVEDMSAFQYLLPTSPDKMIIPDSTGHFKKTFTLAAPSYFRLGRNQLYLTPGDNMEIFVDRNNPNFATFKGRGSEANMFLRGTPFPKSGSYIGGGNIIKPDPEGTIASIKAAAEKRKLQLDSVTNVTAEFRRLETARIQADIINSLNTGEIYSPMLLKLKGDTAKIFAERYKKAIANDLAMYQKDFVDASLMQLVVYRDIADNLLDKGGAEEGKQKIRDWYTSYQLVNEIRKTSDKQALKQFQPRVAAIQTSDYQKAVQASLASMMKFGKGDVAKSFIAKDISGKKAELKSLKGKLIYVDLWATWCGPCMAEMPHYEELKKHYKGNPEVVFVSLSIDDTEEPWKKSVESRNADGYQWLINRNALADYEIVSIPRTIVIDKDFKVADLNAPEPSSKLTIPMIDKLLEKK